MMMALGSHRMTTDRLSSPRLERECNQGSLHSAILDLSIEVLLDQRFYVRPFSYDTHLDKRPSAVAFHLGC